MKTPRPPGLLVLAVLALHLLLGHEVQRIHEGWLREGPTHMPERMQVALVWEMQVQAPPAPRPPPAAAPAARPAPPPVRAGERTGPAAPASEPASTPAAASAASQPAEVPPAAAPMADAASAPTITAAAEAASAATDGEPGPEWPLSTRLTYALTGNYRGPVHGQAQVEWLRRGRDYQVHLDVSIGPSFAPLISRRMSSQGQLTPEGIAPQRYDEETRVLLGEPRRSTVFFLPTEVQLAGGSRVAARRGAQDAASQFVQLTWLFLTGREPLQAGQVVRFPLALPRRQYDDWTYEVVGEAAVEAGFGSLPAWHLRPGLAPQAGDLSAEVWLAPGLQHLPVRLIIRQDAETYIDLMLKQLPLQAAPESGNDIPRRLSP